MSFNQGAYEKHVFLVGDIHRYQTEVTADGQATLRAVDQLLRAIAKHAEQAKHQPSRAKVPLLWEASPVSLGQTDSPLYLRTKARELYQQGGQTQPIAFVASDNLREHNRYLKHFMLNLTYRPKLAMRALKTSLGRRQLAQAIEESLLQQGDLIFTSKLTSMQRTSMPRPLVETMIRNVAWYQEEVNHIKRGLELDMPDLTPEREFVNNYKRVLIRSTADIELLVNLFARPEKIVVVYAGNGHIRRLEAFLQRLGFNRQFEVERHDYLNRKDFSDFWQVYKRTAARVSLPQVV